MCVGTIYLGTKVGTYAARLTYRVEMQKYILVSANGVVCPRIRESLP